VIILLLVCLIYNTVLLVKEICKPKEEDKKVENKNEEDNYLSDTRNKADSLESCLPFFR
jgi:uncharacterized protein YpmS